MKNLGLKTTKIQKVLIHHRYVDIFCLFDNEHNEMLFFNYINTKHPNIKFTHEKQLNGKRPFLDVLLDNLSNVWVTSVFQQIFPTLHH